jgi:thiamine monophosphate kinase
MGVIGMMGIGFGPGDISSLGHFTLWQAVLLKAIDDATRVSVHRTPYALAGPSARDQIAARNWLLAGGDDFELVCHLASFEPERVTACVRSCAAANWRIPENVKPLRRNVGAVVRLAA